jgi:UDP-N-acetylmuramyl pentapeptide synthase
MNMLVLDTIHGADIIGKEFAARGHRVDTVDVYRNRSAVDVPAALSQTYDLVIAPIHLDPGHPLLQSQPAPVISHHEAVRLLLGQPVPEPMVEITGAQGKTTTACALAHTLHGPGILHTSAGTFLYPERQLLWKKSITPASVLAAADKARELGGWLVAEESLGVSGAGSLAIITSEKDYLCAAGKKSALAEKLRSARDCQKVLLAPSIQPETAAMVQLDRIACCEGTRCRIDTGEMTGTFENPLLGLRAYRIPLMLAGAAACLLGTDPAPLSTFQPVDGRLSVGYEGSVVILDNSNSGTNISSTIEAADYARALSGKNDLTLVIGQEPGDGAVCDGFSDDQIIDAISAVRPSRIVIVGTTRIRKQDLRIPEPAPLTHSLTRAAAEESARALTSHGSVVLAVKTWR